MLRGALQKMTVPKMSQLRKGVGVRLEHSTMNQSDTRRLRGGRSGRGGRAFEGDYRLARAPKESLSLFDYVKTPSGTARVSTSETAEPVLTAQEQLESEFPNLDSALISAILIDYPEVAEARTVLSSLS
jgi:hypothetical protein